MANIKEHLLDTLEELVTQDLKRFQWHLTSSAEDKHIPKSHLENANRQDTVDNMVQTYGQFTAVEITLDILRKMNNNQLAEELQTKVKNNLIPSCRHVNTDQAGLVQTITAQTGGSIIAPTLQGSVFYGAVNITCGNSSKAEGQTPTKPGQTVMFGQCKNWEGKQKESESKLLKSILRSQYSTIYEGTAARGRHVNFNEIYTELYVQKDRRGEICTDHEVTQIESGVLSWDIADTPLRFNDVFSDKNGKKVLTQGIAGIGKTVCVQKFVLDWAEGKSNADIDFVFLIPFRELNLLKKKQNLHGLLLHFYPKLKNLKETGLFDDKCRCVFIFDGLDEMRKQLRLQRKEITDITEKERVDVLVKNLIKGALLPSAFVWITSRPAAVDQIHRKDIHLMTEVRGFITDQQKEQYFRNQISEQDQASRIISHIKQSKTLHTMCCMPIFCWITAMVLQKIMNQCTKAPKSLTEMYANFLIIQMSTKSEKHNETPQKDTKKLLESNRAMILKLAELAFKQLIKGNIVFYEEDLKECGIDVTEASVYSGVCTAIFKEESGFYQRKIYCFVHLSFQEFLAAFYVLHCFLNEKMGQLQPILCDHHYDDFMIINCSEDDGNCSEDDGDCSEDDDDCAGDDDDYAEDNDDCAEDDDDCVEEVPRKKMKMCPETHKHRGQSKKVQLEDVLMRAVDKTLESENGHLDLFLRFLLGISLESNQRLLQGLLTHIHSSSESIQETKEYIKELIKDNYAEISAERSINMFLCLTEINDSSLSKEIQDYLHSEKHSEEQLSAAHCSAIAYMLQLSEEVLNELDLKKYNTTEEGYRRLIPATKNCKRALLAGCNFTNNISETLCSDLKLPNSPLIELDLCNTSLQDSGVMILSDGLNSSHCKLEILRLMCCDLTVESCKSLTSALQKENSLKVLELNNNELQDSGVEQLCAGLNSLHCKLEILRLTSCDLTVQSCIYLTSVLQKENTLKVLELNSNKLQDSGVEQLCAGLKSSCCKLEILRLSGCGLTGESCKSLTLVLQTENSLKELELNNNKLQDSGVEQLCAGLNSLHCKLEILRMTSCDLTVESCKYLKSALQKQNSLKVLELNNNELNDLGVEQLCAGLKSSCCKLDMLGLSGCLVTEEGCSSLASALSSNPSHLKELDLTYNYPKDSGVTLSAILKGPHCKLRVEPAGMIRLQLGPRKYACELTLDPKTANICLDLSEEDTKVELVQYIVSSRPEKFGCPQVLCRESLSGCCYWEVEWSVSAAVSVAYKRIHRNPNNHSSWFGFNKSSWCLFCSNGSYIARHDCKDTDIPAPHSSFNRVGVYLDSLAGTLSFYNVPSDTRAPLTHLHTFHSTFTEPLYAGVGFSSRSPLSSAACICKID